MLLVVITSSVVTPICPRLEDDKLLFHLRAAVHPHCAVCILLLMSNNHFLNFLAQAALWQRAFFRV